MVRNSMNNKGFTLIELLVTISIISILSLIGLTLFKDVQTKTRDSIRKSDLNKIATALELYYQKEGQGGYIPANPDPDSCIRDTDTFYENSNIIAYMSDGVVPKDPMDKTIKYCYLGYTNGSAFRLFTKMENEANINLPSNCNLETYNFSVVSDNLTVTCPP